MKESIEHCLTVLDIYLSDMNEAHAKENYIVAEEKWQDAKEYLEGFIDKIS